MDELIGQFSLERVGKHGAKFDPEKAKWFNHQYIQKRSDDDLAAAWAAAQWGKPRAHGIDDAGFVQPARTMSAIGG